MQINTKKNKRTNNENYSVSHCIQRAKERYNVDLTEKNYNDMNNMVRSMNAAGEKPLGWGCRHGNLSNYLQKSTFSMYLV
jgi:hypothetical protein